MDDWIDLCIGCHLCDMVCSSGVNISELNLIAKAKYLDEKGRPFRDWLLTHTYLLGSIGKLFFIYRQSPLKKFRSQMATGCLPENRQKKGTPGLSISHLQAVV